MKVLKEQVVEEDGTWEEDEDEAEHKHKTDSTEALRWQRAVWASARLAVLVDGFMWDKAPSRAEPNWRIENPLQQRVRVWEEKASAEREEEEHRKHGTQWTDSEEMMGVKEDKLELAEDSSGPSDDEDDSDEVRAFKVCLIDCSPVISAKPIAALTGQQQPFAAAAAAIPPTDLTQKAALPSCPKLQLRPGYTVLVKDTSILLSSLVESAQRLEMNDTPLGKAAKEAVLYLTSHIRQYATSLKVQTSRGNYLLSLSVRREQVNFDNPALRERNLDDLILKAAIWQDEHWQDRSSILRIDADKSKDVAGAAKVVLLSLDRNPRLLRLDIAGKRELANDRGGRSVKSLRS
ncbi:hypothetical protein BV25DRAFT_1983795 [Artomyces pyxidatus]|uniref:Uncharacterized protein n=1 Tax=Artomyces pyxidatus TaxID=48021 RepID=A0ACB8SHG2_9AGAM|nr:hypothetical protein BV25DRAFT_1983795 [Artomyces pyxidatus]